MILRICYSGKLSSSFDGGPLAVAVTAVVADPDVNTVVAGGAIVVRILEAIAAGFSNDPVEIVALSKGPERE
jgi:hypothetical protein